MDRTEYFRQYYRDHSEKIRENRKQRYAVDLESSRKLHNSWNKAQRIKTMNLLGTVCYLCGRTNTNWVHYHEIHGKWHPCTYIYYNAHPNDFVPLCSKCHILLHWYAMYADTLKFEELVNKLIE
jgi:predicted HNH restriction endonuclease